MRAAGFAAQSQSMVACFESQTEGLYLIRFLFRLCLACCHCLRKFVNVRHALLTSVFFSNSALVRSVISYRINFGRYNSVIYRNLCTVCKLFNWSIRDFILGRVTRVCLSQRLFTVIIRVHSLLVKTPLSVLCLNY